MLAIRISPASISLNKLNHSALDLPISHCVLPTMHKSINLGSGLDFRGSFISKIESNRKNPQNLVVSQSEKHSLCCYTNVTLMGDLR